MSATARAEALDAIWKMLGVPRSKEASSSKGTRQQGERSATKGGSRASPAQGAPVPMSAGMAYQIVRRGVPSRSLEPLGEYLGLGKGAVAAYLDLDRATVLRKVANDEPLPTHAAESMLRLIELNRLAEETLASPEEAAAWLRRAHPMLDGETPLECAKSAFGAQRVKDILVALKYGGVV